MVISILSAIVAFVVGIFGFSQIFICLFFAIPRSLRLKRQGKIIYTMPVWSKYLPTIAVWTVFLIALFIVAYIFFTKHFYFIMGGFAVSAILSLKNCGANQNNISDYDEQNARYFI